MSNKGVARATRVAGRFVQSLADSAYIQPSADYDGGATRALSQATFIQNPSGSPSEFQTYVLRIRSTTARALTWDTQYRSGLDYGLPSTTTGNGATDYFLIEWNAADNKWDLLAGPSIDAKAGWTVDSNTWVYASASSFTISTGDFTGQFKKGTRISCLGTTFTSVTSTIASSLFTKTAHGIPNGTPVVLTGLSTTTGVTNSQLYYVTATAANTFQLAATPGGAAITLGGTADSSITVVSTVYGAVASSSYNSGTTTTTVNLISTGDYSLTNNTITSTKYSYQASPQGYPVSFNWTPTLTGWSVNPSAATYRWSAVGNVITVNVNQGTAGTSNNVTHTMSAPVACQTLTTYALWTPAVVVDTGSTIKVGGVNFASSGTTFATYAIIGTPTNTASGSSQIWFQMSYEF